MPAYTVRQLTDLLGEYVEPGKDPVRALQQVLPRIYDLGTWRDTTEELSFSTSTGYVALPDGVASVLNATVDNFPRPVRSLWHDVRIFGRTALVSDFTGVVDDGYHPVAMEMRDVQGVPTEDDVVPTNLLRLVRTGSTTYPEFTGSVTVTTNSEEGGAIETSAVDTGTQVNLTAEDDFTKILSIRFADIQSPMDLIDPDFPDKVIATVPSGTGVLRVRRFRVPTRTTVPNVHFLVKYECPQDLQDTTVIRLGNLGAIKHGMLGLIAEDNADLDRAARHWATAGQLLDTELKAIKGAAKATLTWVDAGSPMPVHNLL